MTSSAVTGNAPDIPLLDISTWRSGDADTRQALARRADQALQNSGFLLVEGHDVDASLAARIRAESAGFFHRPAEEKAPLAAAVGGRGWIPPGGEANAFYGELADPTRADLKESLTFGRDFSTGDPAVDEVWFTPNSWPTDLVPGLQPLCQQYALQVRDLYADLLQLCALALGLTENWFTDRATNSPHTFNINRYPPRHVTGAPLDGQFRVAPHTDWGILTVLDRQPGYGGLQVQSTDGHWADAPFEPGALTINVGDLLARWTGDRWRSTRHRVLPPPAEAPNEELLSLIVFLEANVDTVISPLFEGSGYEPVTAGDYLKDRADAATVS